MHRNSGLNRLRIEINLTLIPAGTLSGRETRPISIVVLGNLVLTCDRTDSTAFLVFERVSSDFTRPMSSARNASGRFAKSIVTAAAVSVNEAAQGHRPMRMELRRRCLYAARRS